MIDPNMTNQELYNMIFASLISADNASLTEKEKQGIITRYKQHPDDIHYLLEPIENKEIADKYIDILEFLTKGEEDDPLGLLEK